MRGPETSDDQHALCGIREGWTKACRGPTSPIRRGPDLIVDTHSRGNASLRLVVCRPGPTTSSLQGSCFSWPQERAERSVVRSMDYC